MTKMDEIAELFKSVDDETRMHLLLDFAKKLPALPEKFRAARDAGLNRVPECMTPVFLFVDRENGHPRVYVDVAEEAPTVKGLLSIVLTACNEGGVTNADAIPNDLLNRLGLDGLIRMNRVVGLSAIIGRIKRQITAINAEIESPGTSKN